MNHKRVLILGATVNMGGAALREMLRKGWRERTVTRNSEGKKALELTREGAEVERAHSTMATVPGRESFVGNGRFALSGAIAGAVSSLVFTVVHDIFISDIWFMIIPMLLAGALCGSLIGWSYGLVVAPSLPGWLGYNLVYVTLFGMLGAASVLLFEPVTTMAAVLTLNGPPTALIEQAMPMTVLFTLGMAVLVTVLFGRTLVHFLAVLLTCVVLVASLGLNVSAIGLVEIPRGSLFVVAELFGLIVALNVIYAIVFVALERRWLYKGILGTNVG